MLRSLKTKAFEWLKFVLRRRGFVLINWKSSEQAPKIEIPDESKAYLVPDNPLLVGLNEKYNAAGSAVTNSTVWNWSKGGLGSRVLQNFRGDTAYVWQVKGIDIPELRYLTATYYQLANDTLQLMDRFQDDALFGNRLFNIANRMVSREVLDSANEINFLERNLALSKIKDLRILDIGAGYGRLAHRFSLAFDNLARYYCTDAVPTSAFICDYYLKFRQTDKVTIIPMPDLLQMLSGDKIHLAVNVHSFSECTLESIDWWINKLAVLKVRYLFIVPNAFKDGGSRLLTNKREDFTPIVERYGYKLIIKEPKYNDPFVQRLGLYPTYYFIYELQMS